MTCCVSALADKGQTIVLASDRMIGTQAIAGEPDIRKAIPVHRDWWIQFSGTVAIAVDVIASIKDALPRDGLNAQEVALIVRKAMEKRWSEDSEASCLIPHGWTNDTFKRESNGKLPDELIREIDQQRSWHELDLSLLVSGFDPKGIGHLFSISGSGSNRFMAFHHDIPGYWSIGTGSVGAGFMMSYKDVSYNMPTREVLYYALEGKFFGELGSNVGWDTDAHILRHGKEPIELPEAVIDEYIKAFHFIKPHLLRTSRNAVKIVNAVESLGDLPPLKTYADEEKERKAEKAKPRADSQQFGKNGAVDGQAVDSAKGKA